MPKQNQETEAGKQKWIAETLERRRQAVDLLNECSHPGIDKYQTVNVHDVVRALHAAVLSYSDQIRPKAEELDDDLWDTDLTDELHHPVTVPKDKFIVEQDEDGNEYRKRHGYFLGVVDRYGNADTDSLIDVCDWKTWPINPAKLNEYWRANNQVTLTGMVRDGHDVRKESRTFNVYLPVAASGLLINHFDTCLSEMGWMPAVEDGLDTYGFKEVSNGDDA